MLKRALNTVADAPLPRTKDKGRETKTAGWRLWSLPSKRVGEERVPSSCGEHPSGVILAPKRTTSNAPPEIQDPAPWAPPPAPKGKRAKDTPVFHRKKSSDDGSCAQEGGT